jgi:uncharacterized iron-regulated membrane protein
MNRFRTVLFWMHLTAGSLAGIVVLVMCVTGVALTYEKQLLEWADSRSWSAPLSATASHLTPETLLARVREAQPGAAPTGLSLRANQKAPATLTLEGNASLLVDPYTGTVIGAPPQGLRAFFRGATSWHRYLALEGESRATGRMFTGASNLAFFFIVSSGMYLWIPKTVSWRQVSRIVWFGRGLPPKARHFNWHNVIGIWCAIPLAIVVAGAIPISYGWGNALVYRLVGEEPPPPVAARPGPTAGERDFNGLDEGWAKATSEIPAWRTITVRFSPNAQSPWVFIVDSGYGGQPQKRQTLTIDRASSAILKAEAFGNLTLGRRARSWLRFAHTGEFYGLVGQTIAGVASAGATVLVYTGLSLALRRFFSWVGRSKGSSRDQRQAA